MRETAWARQRDGERPPARESPAAARLSAERRDAPSLEPAASWRAIRAWPSSKPPCWSPTNRCRRASSPRSPASATATRRGACSASCNRFTRRKAPPSRSRNSRAAFSCSPDPSSTPGCPDCAAPPTTCALPPPPGKRSPSSPIVSRSCVPTWKPSAACSAARCVRVLMERPGSASPADTISGDPCSTALQEVPDGVRPAQSEGPATSGGVEAAGRQPRRTDGLLPFRSKVGSDNVR